METIQKREVWNKGKLVGQKPPLKLKDIWAIRIHLQNTHAVRDLSTTGVSTTGVRSFIVRRSAFLQNKRPDPTAPKDLTPLLHCRCLALRAGSSPTMGGPPAVK
jgi:hypothetical protein